MPAVFSLPTVINAMRMPFLYDGLTRPADHGAAGPRIRERPQSEAIQADLRPGRQWFRAAASWRREVMASFRNTLLRWYSTVDVVTNRRVAISALVTPAAARCAICVSCGVRSGPA